MDNKDNKSLLEKMGESQVWKSIIRSGVPRTRRQRMHAILGSIFLHLHPARLPKHAVKVGYTWCMGGLSFFLFVNLTITGILLMFYYRPTVEYAFTDIIDLAEQVPLGIMRELHRWAAHAMVLIVWLHMVRVFMTGSYKPPREFNWGVGVLLMTMTLLLSFTGYLLPWDQLAIWAVTVGSNMARATPFLGHEGPGASLLAIGDINLIHVGSDVRFGLLGGRFNMATLLLAGVAVNSFIGALISAILISMPNNDSLRELLFWLAGGIGGNGWKELQIVFPFIFAGIFAFVIFSRDLNVLMMGGDDALTLGVNPKVMRPVFLVSGALVTGAAVAVSGIIAFVGLVVPHIVRLICGPDNRLLIPLSGIAGAIFVIGADTIARTVIQPAEYRVGIITAFVGAPFFIFLLVRNQKRAQIFQ